MSHSVFNDIRFGIAQHFIVICIFLYNDKTEIYYTETEISNQ